jgi:hypothetical protein
MGRYETRAEIAKALGINEAEAAAALNEADLHPPLSVADLKELAHDLGRAARRTRDPFRNAFLHAYQESLRRSLEHTDTVAVLRQAVFGKLKPPVPLEKLPEWVRPKKEPVARPAPVDQEWRPEVERWVHELLELGYRPPFANMQEGTNWIEEEKKRQGPPPGPVEEPRTAYEAFVARESGRWTEWLVWGDDQHETASCPVAPDSPLDRLRRASWVLASEIGCRVPDATRHILTGAVPVVPLLETHSTYEKGGYQITIRVNFPWVPAELVTKQYEESRRWAYELDRRYAKRPKIRLRPAPKLARVKTFVETTPRMTWPQRLAQWNEENPDEPYSSWQTLQAAYRRS